MISSVITIPTEKQGGDGDDHHGQSKEVESRDVEILLIIFRFQRIFDNCDFLQHAQIAQLVDNNCGGREQIKKNLEHLHHIIGSIVQKGQSLRGKKGEIEHESVDDKGKAADRHYGDDHSGGLGSSLHGGADAH